MELSEFLRRTTKRERAEIAAHCRTSVAYLYQLAGGHRRASPALARRVEAHTKALAARSAEGVTAVPGWSLVRNPATYECQFPDQEGELVLRTIGISRIRPYESGPRRQPNPAYPRIKALIRRDGLRRLLTVVQPPGNGHYVLWGSGNARLQALNELFVETGEARYATATCIVRPWRGEADLLLALFEEQGLRNAPSFIESAISAMRAKQAVERDGDGSELSHERFAALLAEVGCGLSPGQIAQMAYAVQRLLPLLPVALSAGMDQQEVERIRALDQAAGALWAERQIDSQAEYDLTFAALCRRYDGEDWDLGSLRRALETEVAERLGASIQSARMEMDARLRRQRHSPLGRPQHPVRLISKESDP